MLVNHLRRGKAISYMPTQISGLPIVTKFSPAKFSKLTPGLLHLKTVWTSSLSLEECLPKGICLVYGEILLKLTGPVSGQRVKLMFRRFSGLPYKKLFICQVSCLMLFISVLFQDLDHDDLTTHLKSKFIVFAILLSKECCL